ncbi:MAG: hypothetical protein GX879_10985 [Bacteroidales bacterium]|nr:hypothetical protein [Bacteroidales bacterium]
MNVQKLFLLGLFCLIISAGTAFSQKVRKVEIVNAETLEYDARIGNGAKRLKDNVVFKHEDAYMYCDSAYHYASSNTVQAYNNVRIEQGDSLSMSGDIMRYEGEIKMAFVRNNVVLTHYDSYLETDSLNFDRTINMGYYFNGGNIYDGDNHLFSLRGYYYADDKDYYAVDDVVFTNPQYVIYCDTLRYNTGTGISYFYGPTTIVSDSNTIYCENGYYDTRKDLASFSENASLHSDKQILKGDSLFYDRNLRYGKAFNNVSIEDTVENAIAYGNYGIYYEDPQKAMLTDSVLFVYINEGDTLFMHSDTIFIDIDSADNKLIRAFHKVQVFRDDIQARCDSLIYNSADSISEMFGKPVVWSEESQLSGEKMIMHFEDGKAHHVEITGYALIVQEEDIEYYNQIQGRRLVAYLRDSDVYKVEIYNDSQTIYFIRDEETEELSGMNKILCTDMIIYRENKQIERIKFFQKPDGVITPMDQLNNADAFLKDFKWYDKFRPKNKDDIFIWQEID